LASYHDRHSQLRVAIVFINTALLSGIQHGHADLYLAELLKHGIESLLQHSVGALVTLMQSELVPGSLSVFDSQISSVCLLKLPGAAALQLSEVVCRPEKICLCPFGRQGTVGGFFNPSQPFSEAFSLSYDGFQEAGINGVRFALRIDHLAKKMRLQ
jgi:hypothetical protein